MIQELLGVGVVEDRKIPISGGILGVPNEPAPSCSSAHSTSSSSSSPAASSTTSSSPSNADQQSLRCPRCDSTNTKFCYYNNYNLTQPRHFCKTCRRYWTQGGALRNVPIGGGCRKTKSTGISLGTGKSGNGCGGGGVVVKAKPPSASDVVAGKSGFGSAGVGGPLGFDHDLPSLWAAPQNSHLLPLLRAAQSSGVGNTSSSTPSQNPNPNPIRSTNMNPVRIKEEGPVGGSHVVPEASLLINALNARNLGLDPLGQVPLGLCNSLWRSSQYQHPLQHQHQHQHQHQQPVPFQQQQQQPQQQNNIGLLLSESPGSGIQELIQRLRSSNNHYTDQPAVFLGNAGSSSSSSSISFPAPTGATTTTATILEPAPVAGGEFGCWNSTPFAWADMPNINGAFP